MKNHIVFKFLAILVCALSLLVSLASGAGIIILIEAGLYENSLQEVQAQTQENTLWGIAQNLAVRYAGMHLSNCSEEFMELYAPWEYPKTGAWSFTLKDADGKLLEDTRDSGTLVGATPYEFLVTPHYPVILEYENLDSEQWQATVPPTSASAVPDPIIPGTIAPSSEDNDYLHIESYGYFKDDTNYLFRLGILRGPVYLVTLYLQPDALPQSNGNEWKLAEWGYQNRFHLPIFTGAGLLLFAVTLVYLCCAAGKRPKADVVQPGGLNMLPLDLYAFAVCGSTVFAVVLCADFLLLLLDQFSLWLILLGVAAIGYVVCLLAVGFLFACAAQFKMRNGYWWRHSVVGAVLLGSFRLLKTIFGLLKRFLKAAPSGTAKAATGIGSGLKVLLRLCKRLILGCWKIVLSVLGLLGKTVQVCWRFICRICRGFWKHFSRFWGRLPLTWQWLLTGFAMIAVLSASLSAYNRAYILWGVGICLAIIFYGAHCFGSLLENTKRMSEGNLDIKVDDHLLIGCFEEFATHLNSLAGVAEQAARDKMKSERMKAELVTNVSHDIKTPLTSIINYVDLLQKTDSPEETAQYLEVLDRQSQRLKKLIDDLMEMSKASTGNTHVDIQTVNAVEAINQALGEFSEKLEKVELTPIFQPPEEPLYMEADGRLTWRVLSNLLSNVVKYALPGTRVYVDLVKLDDRVLISLKNVSKEQLNVSSEELMERFVRGDASRNTEGSGLGLNIAKSLMELQNGQLQLLVDGDLFKATLVFPAI